MALHECEEEFNRSDFILIRTQVDYWDSHLHEFSLGELTQMIVSIVDHDNSVLSPVGIL